MNQYLSTENTYQRQLLKFAKGSYTCIVACTEESMEPCYEGFWFKSDAIDRAKELEATTGFSYSVYRLFRREESPGDWMCDYEDVRSKNRSD
jgi:hypothetical protein